MIVAVYAASVARGADSCGQNAVVVRHGADKSIDCARISSRAAFRVGGAAPACLPLPGGAVLRYPSAKSAREVLERFDAGGPFGARVLPDVELREVVADDEAAGGGGGGPAPVPPGSGWPPLGPSRYWGLDRVDQADRVADTPGRSHEAGDGEGVTVYVVDSGVWRGHVALPRSRVEEPQWYTTPCPAGYCTDHGTEVAGVIAGTGVGMAPMATIAPLNVFDGSGHTCLSQVVHALDYVEGEERHGDGAVVNLSMECSSSEDCGETIDGRSALALLDAKVTELRSLGVITVVAAGNHVADGTGLPGPYGDLRDLRDAIVVGRLTRADLAIPVGAGADLFAPSEDVWTTSTAGPSTAINAMWTSTAAGVVSGAVAVDLGNSRHHERHISAATRADRVTARLLERATCVRDCGTATEVKVLCLRACPMEACPPAGRAPSAVGGCREWTRRRRGSR